MEEKELERPICVCLTIGKKKHEETPFLSHRSHLRITHRSHLNLKLVLISLAILTQSFSCAVHFVFSFRRVS